jgi:hypothetical protein
MEVEGRGRLGLDKLDDVPQNVQRSLLQTYPPEPGAQKRYDSEGRIQLHYEMQEGGARCKTLCPRWVASYQLHLHDSISIKR